jgi:hypothetical protein
MGGPQHRPAHSRGVLFEHSGVFPDRAWVHMSVADEPA